MRILLLDQFSDPGGAQRAVLDLLPAFRERHWRAVVAMPGNGDVFRRVYEAGFETARLDFGPYRSGRKSIPDTARFLRDAPRVAAQIRRLAEVIHADLIYVNGPRLLPAMALAGFAGPVLFHSHSVVGGGARTLAGWALRRMNARIVAACQLTAAAWRPYLPAERISVVYNGVAGAWADDKKRSSAPLIGCIGRIAPEKGQREFIAAARIIHRTAPDCRFVVHGSALFSPPGYEAEVRAAGAGLPIRFEGWAPDVYAALNKIDLLLVPSTGQEANPRVILEAFAAGVPVIAFRSGGIPEIIEDGVNGFLARSAEEMARLTIRLLSDERSILAEVAGTGRETWRQRFTLDRYRQELMNILNSTAAAPVTAAAPASTGP